MIETAMLRLREWREDDIEPFIEATNTPAVMRYLGGVRSVERMREVCRTRFMAWQQAVGYTFWIAERRFDGTLLGCCGLRPLDDGSGVEFGLRLIPAVWGTGIGKEGTVAALEYGFSNLGLTRIFATAHQDNTASRHLLERAGMERHADIDEPPILGFICRH